MSTAELVAAPASANSLRGAQVGGLSARASGDGQPRRRLTARVARLSLATQFPLASLVVLVLGMLVIGSWVSQAIERGVLNRGAALTALYVDSVLSPHLESLAWQSHLDAEQVATFDHLLADTPLGQRVLVFKVWSPRGEVLYSPDRRLMGQQFGVDDALARPLQGEVSAELSDLDEPENACERERWSRLLEPRAQPGSTSRKGQGKRKGAARQGTTPFVVGGRRRGLVPPG